MSATPRELVCQTLDFRGPARAPRQLWLLPWAATHYPEELRRIQERFPDDIVGVSGHLSEYPSTQGDPYALGDYTDEWGATFHSVQPGVVGEVKVPLIADWSTDVGAVHVPREWLTVDRDAVNRDCAATDRFTMAAACPRPFEQLQFLRGSENVYVDLADPPAEMLAFLRDMHAFYCQQLEIWARTDVDTLMMMDDWGSQRGLLIRPAIWREIFRPMYRDYIQIAHAAGKRAFMHSDGHTLAIYPDLVELGLDAFNSQIFCIGVEDLVPYAGKITFWGEIDRQGLLPNAAPAEIDAAVRRVHSQLWRDGGCIAQCEFGAGAKPGNVWQVYESWDEVSQTVVPGP